MTQLRLPQSALDAMSAEELETFKAQFADVRLGEPAEDLDNPGFVVWDDGRFETVTLHDDKVKAIASDLKITEAQVRAAVEKPRVKSVR